MGDRMKAINAKSVLISIFALKLRGSGFDGQPQQLGGDSIGSVSHDIAFVHKVSRKASHAKTFDFFTVHYDTTCSFQGVLGLQRFANRGRVNNRVVEDWGSGMLVELANVIRGREAKA